MSSARFAKFPFRRNDKADSAPPAFFAPSIFHSFFSTRQFKFNTTHIYLSSFRFNQAINNFIIPNNNISRKINAWFNLYENLLALPWRKVWVMRCFGYKLSHLRKMLMLMKYILCFITWIPSWPLRFSYMTSYPHSTHLIHCINNMLMLKLRQIAKKQQIYCEGAERAMCFSCRASPLRVFLTLSLASRSFGFMAREINARRELRKKEKKRAYESRDF